MRVRHATLDVGLDDGVPQLWFGEISSLVA